MKTYTDLLEIGNSFLIQHAPDNWIRYHVRGIVDDQYVIRYWSKVKRCWVYKLQDADYFRMFYDDGLIKP